MPTSLSFGRPPTVLATLAAIDERRIKAVVTIVADHLCLEVNGCTLDGPLHRVERHDPE